MRSAAAELGCGSMLNPGLGGEVGTLSAVETHIEARVVSACSTSTSKALFLTTNYKRLSDCNSCHSLCLICTGRWCSTCAANGRCTSHHHVVIITTSSSSLLSIQQQQVLRQQATASTAILKLRPPYVSNGSSCLGINVSNRSVLNVYLES